MHFIPLSWVIHLVEGQQVRRRWNWYLAFSYSTQILLCFDRNQQLTTPPPRQYTLHTHFEPKLSWENFLPLWCFYLVPPKGCQTLGIFKSLSWVRAIRGTVRLTIKVRLFRATGQHWPLEGRWGNKLSEQGEQARMRPSNFQKTHIFTQRIDHKWKTMCESKMWLLCKVEDKKTWNLYQV